MTVKCDQTVNWPIENRPQDRRLNGIGLTIEPADRLRPLPGAINVSDADCRSCTYVAAYRGIVKERGRTRSLMFATFDHEFPDLMPQAIEVRDGQGNVFRYVAVNPLDDKVKLFATARRAVRSSGQPG